MNRRSFLSLAAAVPLIAAAPALTTAPQLTLAASAPDAAPEAATRAALPAAPARRFLGTADGRVYRSLEQDQALSLVANFGKHCSVRQISDTGDALEATLETEGFEFTLLSKDGRVWRTPARASRRA